MDDEFLYRLRIDPPERFAVRLKARLDRRSNSARRVTGWSLLFVLCGTAFALTLPQVRQSIARLLTSASESARSVPSPSSPVLNRTAAPDRSEEGLPAAAERPSSRSHRSPAPAAANSSGQQRPPPAPEVSMSVAPATDVPAPVVVPRIIMLTTPPEDGRTPGELARQAVATRRGLFRVMGWAMTSVTQMLRQETPVDADAVATSGARIQSLAAMIPDVYAIDTRPFLVDTQSLDKIWSDLPGFGLKIDQLAKAAYALNAAGQGGDPQVIRLAAGQVATACSGCHEAYRKPVGNSAQ